MNPQEPHKNPATSLTEPVFIFTGKAIVPSRERGATPPAEETEKPPASEQPGEQPSDD